MAEITAQKVAELREKTGVGMMKCKEALQQTNGDLQKAIEFLREQGESAAAKKSNRVAAEGGVFSYIHNNNKIGVLLEVNCETDFCAQNEDFKNVAKDIAMQIAATNPLYVRAEEVPAGALDKEKEILMKQAINEGKPEAVAQKMVEGRIKKYYEENCLMDMKFVKDPSKTVSQFLNEIVLKIGEKITVRRFVRYVMGEGLEKRQDDFAAEVAAQSK